MSLHKLPSGLTFNRNAIARFVCVPTLTNEREYKAGLRWHRLDPGMPFETVAQTFEDQYHITWSDGSNTVLCDKDAVAFAKFCQDYVNTI